MTHHGGSRHESWAHAWVGAALGIGLLWAVAFAVLELSYFTVENAAYPVGIGHVLLVLLLVVQLTLATWIAVAGIRVTGFLWRGWTPALATLAGPWLLLLVLAVSHYRDRMLIHQRTLGDLLLTLGMVAVFGVVFLLLGAWGSRRPAALLRRVLAGAGGLLLVGSVAWFLSIASPEDDTAPVDYVLAEDVGPPVDTGLRVLIVGLDGVDWKVADPLIEQGRMPALAHLRERGVTANLKSVIPTYSPNLWTSIATGKTLEKHGVPSHVFTRLPLGLPNIVHDPRHIRSLTKFLKADIRLSNRAGLLKLGVYTSDNVKSRRIWDILGDFGLRSVVLEWYVTHPARPLDGVEVSSRFHLASGAELASAVYPSELAPSIAPRIVRPEATRERIVDMMDTSGLDAAGRRELAEAFPDVVDGLSREMARDLTTQAILPDMFPEVPDWRFAGVYYRGMDGSHHVAWKYRGLPGDELDLYPERRLRDVVDHYYEFGDSLLASALEWADENTVVIVLSDHGWESELWGHARKPDGVCVMAGGPVIRSPQRLEISVYDVMPTVLALLGIPVPEDIDGQVAAQFFDPAFLGAHPVRLVSSYERPREHYEAGEVSPSEEDMLEQLRTLGYVGN